MGRGYEKVCISCSFVLRRIRKAIHNIEIFAEGKTVEEAVNTAQSYLDKYLECAFSYDVEIPEATPFETMIDMYPKNLVVLVESKLDDKNKAV